MTDRRTDDTRPLVPKRSLAGPGAQDNGAKKPLSERVPTPVGSAGQAASAAPEPVRRAPLTRPAQPAQPVDQRDNGTAQPIGKPFRNARQPAPRTSGPRVRKARLRLTHVDPWSVMKTAFLLSVAIGIVTVVAVAVVWGVLGVAGVWESINKTVVDVVGGDTARTFDIKNYLGTSRVMGFTMIIAVVDVVLITAVATLGAFLYNLSAALLGGLEVTLAEDEH